MSLTLRRTLGRPRVGHGARRGFTLIELLIVGALIALFAGLAIFGAQQAYLNNQRKAVIGESRQVATALDFAYGDVGFFPLLCFMDDSLDGLTIESQQAFGNTTSLFNFMQINMIPTTQKVTGIRANWKGPYFSPSQSRSQVSQGRGGSKQMELNIGGTIRGPFAWPADTYGSPYVVYNLNIDVTTPTTPRLYFASRDGFGNGAGVVNDPTVKGNYVNAVVSYGRNRLPGGGETPLAVNSASQFMLYETNPIGGNIDAPAPLRYLEADDFSVSRAGMWSTAYSSQGGSYVSSNDNAATVIGITDTGSDDIVFTF